MQELETISKMVLDKQSERPMLIIAWGRFLKMFHECYPESRLTLAAPDGRVCTCTCGNFEPAEMVDGPICKNCGCRPPVS